MSVQEGGGRLESNTQVACHVIGRGGGGEQQASCLVAKQAVVEFRQVRASVL